MTPYYQDDAVTIYHGDCREIMPDLEYDCILADPPYGIKLRTNYRHREMGRRASCNDYPPVFGDDKPFEPAHLMNGRPVILWGGNHYGDKLPVGGWLVWDKLRPDGINQAGAELAWTSEIRPVRVFRHLWNGLARASEHGESYHPTQKPVALMSWCLGFLPDGVVLDPYLGSGPTLRAAKDLGRKAIGIEIEERYCEIAANRMIQEVLGL